MSPLDWIFLAALLLSLGIGAWRGLVYELMLLAAWIAAFVLAQWLAPELSANLPMMGKAPEAVRYAAGFVLVFVIALFAFGLLAWWARRVVRAAGLRPVDRTLGAFFGVTRGVVLLLAGAVVVNLTAFRSAGWWQESAGAGVLTAALRGLKPALPDRFGHYLPG